MNDDAAREGTAEHPLDAELRLADRKQEQVRAKPRPATVAPSDTAVALVDRLERQSAEIQALRRAGTELKRRLVKERRLRHELEREHAGVVRIVEALEGQLEEAWSRLQAAQSAGARRRAPWRRRS